MADKYPIASNADGTVRWSDGSTSGGMSTPQGYVSSSRVPGTSMSTTNSGYQVPSTTTPQPQQSSGGGSSSSNRMDRNANPGSGYFYDAADGWKQIKSNLGPDTAAIDAVYNPLDAYLSQQESIIAGQMPSVMEAAENAYTTNLNTLSGSFEQGNQQLGEQGIQTEQSRQSAENQGRQLYNELQRGGIQRFGGSTSAGQGYGELLGVEQQRTQAQTAQQYTTAKREIDTAKYNLAQDFENKKLQLQQQKQEAQNNIRIEFENKLMEIKGMRAQAASDKAAAQLNALQDMKNKMYQLDVANMQYQQQLQLQAQEAQASITSAENNLSQYLTSGQSAANTMGARTSQIGTGLSMDQRNNYTSDRSSPYIGQISSNQSKKDELGSYLPLGRTLSF